MKTMEKTGQRFHPLVHSPESFDGGLDQVKAMSQVILSSFPYGWQGPKQSSIAFPKPLAEF